MECVCVRTRVATLTYLPLERRAIKMSVLAKLIGEEEFVETLRSMAECPVCISVPRYVQKRHERCNLYQN